MMFKSWKRLIIMGLVGVVLLSGGVSGVRELMAKDKVGGEVLSFERLGESYVRSVRPLVVKYCLKCHSTEEMDGELDLEVFKDLRFVRTQPGIWQKVVEQIDDGEMPPKKSEQLKAEEKLVIKNWVGEYLKAEALANAGDPGPVVLRRLNNTEYTYTVRDLTGVASLNPAEQFPVDSAAGEGFTNTGASLVMSPSLFEKYLESGREIAKHAVLMPNGFRFSEGTTRREWTNELVNQIRGMYEKYTTGNNDVGMLDRWSVRDPKEATANDGRVDLRKYIDVLVRYRDELKSGGADLDEIAKKHQVNAKYLGMMVEGLLKDGEKTHLMGYFAERIAGAQLGDVSGIVNEIKGWQKQLWKFNSVGHFGSIRPWQVANNPIADRMVIREALEGKAGEETLRLRIALSDGGDKGNGDYVVVGRPRIEFKGGRVLMLSELPALARGVSGEVERELGRTDEYLAGVVAVRNGTDPIEKIASERKLNVGLLQRWRAYLDVDKRMDLQVSGHYPNLNKDVHGHKGLSGWGHAKGEGSMTANTTNEVLNFLTITAPARSVLIHPWPVTESLVVWKSPIGGKVQVSGLVADADNKCGNGASWAVEVWRESGVKVLKQGVFNNGGRVEVKLDQSLEVKKGEVIALVVDARDKSHACDSTHVKLKIEEIGNGTARVWDLDADVLDRVLEGNPLGDQYGHGGVWHFISRNANQSKNRAWDLPEGSMLAKWREAVVGGKDAKVVEALGVAVREMLTGKAGAGKPDEALRGLVKNWHGPLGWITLAGELKGDGRRVGASSIAGVGLEAFGASKLGVKVDKNSVIVEAPKVLEIQFPAAIVSGGTFVADVGLANVAAGDGSVQVKVIKDGENGRGLLGGVSMIVKKGSGAEKQVLKGYDDFRALYPDAMCYARIVPVDEVVTLVLYHREDEHFARLMLDEKESKRLDDLWEALRFVSRDALTIMDAYEQILAFATQDGDPKVLEPLRKPINENAKQFKEWLVKAEGSHVEALLGFAEKAYRRPLKSEELSRLRGLYDGLRKSGVDHEEAFAMVLGSVFASPGFLYRLEHVGEGKEAVAVTDWELATRLSYLLWSSAPDDELRSVARAGRLQESGELVKQMQRMLKDEKAQRMSVEFMCQWLHLRDFDKHDEKNEREFPEFKGIRSALYEEATRYFADLIQNDGSVLSLLESDYTFLNEKLAKHYGIQGVSGDGWRKVAGVKQYGRGGLMGMGSVLAKQSGASRTSPILRGTWVFETILGERMPKPPANVPELPTNERGSKLTIRELVEKHSAVEACAVCHRHIDHFGFALERFDAIGRFREKDVVGRVIDTKVKFPGGYEVEGVSGMRDYLLNVRGDAFLTQFCKKLVGYALGRSVQFSDQPLIDRMKKRLAESEYRFSVALEEVVKSEQFRKIRGRGYEGVEIK